MWVPLLWVLPKPQPNHPPPPLSLFPGMSLAAPSVQTGATIPIPAVSYQPDPYPTKVSVPATAATRAASSTTALIVIS